MKRPQIVKSSLVFFPHRHIRHMSVRNFHGWSSSIGAAAVSAATAAAAVASAATATAAAAAAASASSAAAVGAATSSSFSTTSAAATAVVFGLAVAGGLFFFFFFSASGAANGLTAGRVIGIGLTLRGVPPAPAVLPAALGLLAGGGSTRSRGSDRDMIPGRTGTICTCTQDRSVSAVDVHRRADLLEGTGF